MIKFNNALLLDSIANEITIFFYRGNFVVDLQEMQKQRIKIKSANGQKELDFYKDYYEILDENVTIIF